METEERTEERVPIKITEKGKDHSDPSEMKMGKLQMCTEDHFQTDHLTAEMATEMTSHSDPEPSMGMTKKEDLSTENKGHSTVAENLAEEEGLESEEA